MKLKSIAKNQTEVQFISGKYEITVFFSYETPVAVHVTHTDPAMMRILVTTTKYSVTTTKHIKKFITRYNGEVVNVHQDSIYNVLNFYTDK
jgi:hypothetical protein